MNFTDIDLNLVRSFLTVVESGGFTQASKLLHLTQSGITLKVKRLEEQLNCRLFRRTTPPLELSHEGEIVLGYGRRLLDLNQEMTERVSKPKEAGVVRLGVLDHFGPQLLPMWIAEFRSAFPEVKIVSDIGLTFDLLREMEEDKFDLVIASAGYTAMSDYKPAAPILETHLLAQSLFWVQSENSKIDVKSDPLPLVMFGPKCRFRPMALEALQKAGRAYEIVFVGGNLNSVASGVMSDLGLSVMTHLSLMQGVKILNGDSGLPDLPQANLSIYSRKKNHHPMVPRLTAFLVEAMSLWHSKQLIPQLAQERKKVSATEKGVRVNGNSARREKQKIRI